MSMPRRSPRSPRVISSLVAGIAATTPAYAQEFRASAQVGATVLAAADIDGSGHVDLLTLAANGLQLRLDPGLTANGVVNPVAPSAPYNPTIEGSRLVDLDGDGVFDVVIQLTNAVGAVDLVWIRGLGNGAFGPAQILGTFAGWFHNRFQVGDFDGNGALDLACLDGSNFHMPTVEILMQTQGTFTRSTLQVAADFCVGDFDGDGIHDLVTGVGAGTIYQGSPTGFAPARTYSLSSAFMGNYVGDLDGDARDDIVWFAFNSVQVQWGDAANVLLPGLSPLPTTYTGQYLATTDLDADGIRDLVIAGSSTQLLRGRTGRTFSPPQIVAETGLDGIFVDLDGDGDADHVTRSGQRHENLASYGASCGAPMHLSTTIAVPGAAWQLAIEGAPANTIAAILVGSADQWNACGTLVNPASLVGALPLLFTDSLGAAVLPINLPPGFVGGPYYLQAIALDPSGGYQRYGVHLSSSAGRAARLF
jgi:hypothetical protein